MPANMDGMAGTLSAMSRTTAAGAANNQGVM